MAEQWTGRPDICATEAVFSKMQTEKLFRIPDPAEDQSKANHRFSQGFPLHRSWKKKLEKVFLTAWSRLPIVSFFASMPLQGQGRKEDIVIAEKCSMERAASSATTSAPGARGARRPSREGGGVAARPSHLDSYGRGWPAPPRPARAAACRTFWAATAAAWNQWSQWNQWNADASMTNRGD